MTPFINTCILPIQNVHIIYTNLFIMRKIWAIFLSAHTADHPFEWSTPWIHTISLQLSSRPIRHDRTPSGSSLSQTTLRCFKEKDCDCTLTVCSVFIFSWDGFKKSNMLSDVSWPFWALLTKASLCTCARPIQECTEAERAPTYVWSCLLLCTNRRMAQCRKHTHYYHEKEVTK